jgi:hypothetical protein
MKNNFAAWSGRKIRPASAPQFTRRTAEQRKERLIESANAAEPRGKRDLRHRQARLVNKLLGEENAAGLRHRNR